MEKKKDGFAVFSAVCFMLVFLFLLVMQVRSAVNYAAMVQAAEAGPLTPGGTVAVKYQDILTGQAMGLELPEESQEAAQAWFDDQFPPIRQTMESLIFNGAVVMVTAAFVFFEYFLYKRSENNNFRQGFSILLTAALVYAVFAGVLYAALVFKDCYPSPGKQRLRLILCGLLAMGASTLFFGKLLRISRHPKLMAVLNLPIAFVLYFVSMFCELYVTEQGDSLSRGLRLALTAVEWINPMGGLYLSATTPEAPEAQIRLFMIKSGILMLLFFIIYTKNRKKKKLVRTISKD